MWEHNGVQSPKVIKDREMEFRRRRKTSLTRSISVPPHLSDPSLTQVSQTIDRRKLGRQVSATSQRLPLIDYSLGGFDLARNGNRMEIQTQPQVQTSGGYGLGIKTRLKDMRNGLVTSKELLNVLYSVWGVKDYPSSIASLVAALRLELDQAHFHVDLLIQEQSMPDKTYNHLKQIAEANAAWKSKERERRCQAVSSMAAHVEIEKKMRSQTERMNKKLGKELADTRASLSMALKDLENEKRARDVLEQACDELARGIREYQAEVEELKQETEQVQEELEKERDMLRIADTLREERVQMKLSEARYHFEEKNSAVEKLRSKLEGYLLHNENKEKEESHELSEIEELREFLQNTGIENHNTELNEFEDSVENDQNSFELKMENNNHINERNDADSRSSSEVCKGRKSFSEKVQWGSISLNRGMSDENYWIENGTFSDFVSGPQKNNEGEIKRHRPMRCVRDQLFPTSRLPLIRGFSGPVKQWGECSTPRD